MSLDMHVMEPDVRFGRYATDQEAESLGQEKRL